MPDTPTVVSPASAAASSLNEAQLVQNAALGGVLIWQFVRTFTDKAAHGCPLPLCFVILPILFHHATRKAAESTSPASPLSKFVEKFESNREQLLAIHNRMVALRPLTFRSLQLASSRALIEIEPENETALAARMSSLPPKHQPERLRKMLRAAEKLGLWMAPHSISNIASTLRVYF